MDWWIPSSSSKRFPADLEDELCPSYHAWAMTPCMVPEEDNGEGVAIPSSSRPRWPKERKWQRESH
jgi:hypothetical protein